MNVLTYFYKFDSLFKYVDYEYDILHMLYILINRFFSYHKLLMAMSRNLKLLIDVQLPTKLYNIKYEGLVHEPRPMNDP